MIRPILISRGAALRLAAAALAAAGLSGCADRFDHFGKPPSFSSLAESRDPIDPTLPPGPAPEPYQPQAFSAVGAAYAPAPAPGDLQLAGGRIPAAHLAQAQAAQLQAAQLQGARAGYPTASIPAQAGRPSLWNARAGSLFADRRARGVGDILTVEIEIDDEASVSNTTERKRSGSDTVAVDGVFGLEEVVDRVIPGDAVGLGKGVSTSGDSDSKGEGTISRNESISLRVAARVVAVLPNGHLVVTGNQEVRVNFELRDLQVAGIIRPEDISRQNTITYDRMANARISYGGRGHISDFQQPRLGQQLVDVISPF